ncbi:PLATZ transcription factor [Musa troglodytarum]|uniref:PLATZ transcription factor n=1 Tax=Musa troglodytarum TaxID=320322 RepID=A0A9E7EWF7_9LILI|nr:PLATZ transcription factor [Musa troglodytarum]
MCSISPVVGLGRGKIGTWSLLASDFLEQVGYSSSMPGWLEAMLGEKFFNPCMIHETSKKNEKNIFCLDCCSSFCPQCLPPHRPHRLLQVRRYVYHDVVRVDDLEKLIDCSSVQSYTTNSAKVVFLNERPPSRPFRGSGNACLSCYRPLQDPYFFCSLSCKVKELLRSEGGLWKELRECEYLPLSCELDEGQLTPDSILESASATSSASSGGGAAAAAPVAAGTEAASRRKKRTSAGSGSGRRGGDRAALPEMASRRKKGVPVRAPLF